MFFDEIKNIKKAKITKRSHACRGYAITYKVKVLNSFNPELQLKYTEFSVRNKLKEWLNEKGLNW